MNKHCQDNQEQHLDMVAKQTQSLEGTMDKMRNSLSLQQQTISLLEEKLQEEQAEWKRLAEMQKSSASLDPAALMADSRFQAALKVFLGDQFESRMATKAANIQISVQLCEQRSMQADESCQLLRERIQESANPLGQMTVTAARSDAALAEVDLRLLAVETNSHNGLIIFKINNFARRHEEARTGRRVSLYSPTFYTSRHGYKVCLRVYLNGDGSGKGSHISVFFTIMKGEFDALLDWPFRAKVTFAILDQGPARHHRIESFIPDPNSSSFQKPVNDMNIASGCPKMISHCELYRQAENFLAGDCLWVMADVAQLPAQVSRL